MNVFLVKSLINIEEAKKSVNYTFSQQIQFCS